MKKNISLILFILFSVSLFAKIPKVFVSYSPKKIESGNEVKVKLGAIAKKGSKIIFPSINIIDGNTILNKKIDSEIVTKKINDKNVTLIKKVTTYTIKPKKSFDMQVFTIKVNNKELKTVPFRVKVVDIVNKTSDINNKKSTAKIEQNQDKKSKKQDSNFIFQMSSTKKDVVVGEPFIVRVELFEPIEIGDINIEYTPPVFDGFKVNTLGDGKVIEKDNNVIRTIEYIVTPKKEGIFTIKGAKAKAEISLNEESQTPFGFFGSTAQWKDLETNSLKINVKKAPSNVEIIGEFKAKTILDNKFAKANKPFKYIIEIEGIGNLDNLKDPEIKIKNITSYSKEPRVEYLVKNNEVYSRYTKEFTFISDTDFTIPEFKYKIYSPKLKKVYNLKIKPFKVIVKKSTLISEALSDKKDTKKEEKGQINNSNTIKKEKNDTKNIDSNFLDKKEELLFDKYYYKRKYSKDLYSLYTVIGALILGLILGAGGVILLNSINRVKKFTKKRLKPFDNYEDALTILYPHVTEDKSIENMVEQLYEVVNGNNTIKIDEHALKKMIKKIKKDKKALKSSK